MSDGLVGRQRLARTIRRLSVPIILAWLTLAVVLTVLVPPLEKVGDAVSVPLSPADAPSVQATKSIGQKFKEYDSDNIAMVILIGAKELDDDAGRYYESLLRQIGQDTKHVEHIATFWHKRITSAGVQSVDGRAAYVLINLAVNQGGARGNESADAVRKIVAQSKPPNGVKAYVAGHGVLLADTLESGNQSLTKLTPVTILVITMILLFFYRSISTVLIILFFFY